MREVLTKYLNHDSTSMVKEIKFDNLKSVMKQIIDGSYLRASILGIQRVIHVSVTNLNNVSRKENESRSPSERAV